MKIRIIHFSDTHAPARLEHGSAFFDKRLLGLLNSSVIRKGRYDQNYLPAMIRYILANPPDLAVFTGDATSCGQPSEFASALRMFKPLLKSDIPFLYVPGNHDAYVPNARCRSALERFTLAMSRGKIALKEYPLALDFPYFRLLAIHCAKPVNPVLSSGVMDQKTADFLQRETSRKDNCPIICAGHFPLCIGSSRLNFRRRLYGASRAAELLRDRKITLSLCGHIHHPQEKLNDNGHGEIVSGSLTKTGSFAEIILDTDARTFSLRRISLVNTEYL